MRPLPLLALLALLALAGSAGAGGFEFLAREYVGPHAASYDGTGAVCDAFGTGVGIGKACFDLPADRVAWHLDLLDDAPWTVGASWLAMDPLGRALGNGVVCEGGDVAFPLATRRVEVLLLVTGVFPCGVHAGPATHGEVRLYLR